jgi:hypothetical protein
MDSTYKITGGLILFMVVAVTLLACFGGAHARELISGKPSVQQPVVQTNSTPEISASTTMTMEDQESVDLFGIVFMVFILVFFNLAEITYGSKEKLNG